MANLEAFTKDPDSELPWKIDLRPWCVQEDNDTVTEAEAILQDDTTMTAPVIMVNDNQVTMWLAGGTANVRETVTCRWHTLGGRTEDQSFVVIIRPK